MQDERNYGTAGGSTGGTGSGLGSSASGFSGSTGGTTSGMGTGSTGNLGTTATGGMGATGGGTATIDELKQRADGLMDTAAEKLEEVAEKVDSVAGLIPKKGVGGQANAYGHTAADTLESVARWLRDNDTATLQRELGGLVANRPLSMALLAVAAGFVAGKVLR
jgi:hypothetical protein